MSLFEHKPKWLRRRPPPLGRSAFVRAIVQGSGLHTVCLAAKCPNQMDCFSSGTAAFLLLGPSCTRRCTFCAIAKIPVNPPDAGECESVADAAAHLKLSFCVLTMVTRDDLPDGGARHIIQTIKAIRDRCPGIGMEILISDLGGNWVALDKVLNAQPEVLNHNVETVQRLYTEVRPQANYARSLDLLGRASSHVPDLVTKSGIMLGLGETRDETVETMRHICEAGCQLLTLGQYLCPSERHHPVVRYVPPEEFDELKTLALGMGFKGVESAPLVRSSYNAESLYKKILAGT
jgi:lipoic acid synthetase